MSKLLETFQELNLSNYGPDDVDQLNAWAIDAYAELSAIKAQGVVMPEPTDSTLDTMRREGLSIDGDNAYKRDLLDSVIGALAFGKQRSAPPPAGHWLERFYEIGRAEADERDQLYAAPVSEAKAQGVVMPERWNVPRPMWKDARQPYGNPLNHADIEAAEKFNLALDEVARLNSAPAQQVSVPDGWKLVPVEPTPKMIDATWYHEIDMSCGIESQGARNKRIYEAMLIAAPAAPAADATVRQATDGGRNQSYEGLFDGETEEQRASRLAAHSAKGVV